MVKDCLLAIGDRVKAYLHDCVIEGRFIDECAIGIIVSDEKEKNKYRLIPIELIQHLEYSKKEDRNGT